MEENLIWELPDPKPGQVEWFLDQDTKEVVAMEFTEEGIWVEV